MLVSFNALKKLVNLDGYTAEDIADKLTFSGVEVEEVFSLASASNLVIGQIVKCENHPDSDHLHVLDVNLGDKYGITQIVCGAPNARVGLKVIVAMVGAKLPAIEIKKGVIRGVESNGMCCSLAELGVENKYLSEKQIKGIEELDESAPVGEEDVLGYLGLDDKVLNLKVLANRPDLLSLMNVAREVGAILDREVKLPESNELHTFDTNFEIGIESDKCSQFALKEVHNVKIKESPKWMKEFLRSMGVRSINNIVDIGNYVMLMTGQPLHMYDLDKLSKRSLIVRSDIREDFVALDEKTYEVIPGDILITSNGKGMCLGGVMGALECLVDENTTNIVIESASFDAKTIRHTSSRLGLVSESSQRFVKGTYHFQAKYVLEYTANLVKELCDADEFSNVIEIQKEDNNEQICHHSVSKINNRLGTSFTKEEISETLSSLGFVLNFVNDDEFDAKVPYYRLDITSNDDLSEEVIRLRGFEHVKSVLPVLAASLGALSDEQLKERTIRYYLLNRGLNECLTYSLVSKEENEKLVIVNDDEPHIILNPLTDDHLVFRRNVAGSLLNAANYNVNHQNKNFALFEVSNIITKNREEKHLAIVLVGNDNNRALMKNEAYSFYHMKGYLEGIMELLGIDSTRYQLVRSSNDSFHPGRSADIIIQGQKVGSFGELHPNVKKQYDFGKMSVILLEMKLDELLACKTGVIKAKPYSKYPVVTRDLSLVLSKDVASKDVINLVKKTGKGIVKEVEVFDLFSSKELGNNVSLSITITFGSDESTLTDKDINEALDRIKLELAKNFNASLRS